MATATESGIEISEISNPAAVGWEWTVTEQIGDETEKFAHEIVWIRGTTTMLFGSKIHGRWYTSTITNPERFGDVSTLDGARAAAHNFIFDREPGEGPRRMH